MYKILNLSHKCIDQLREEYAFDEHFLNIAEPRLRLLNAVKTQINNDLVWTVNFSMTNKAENCVNISLPDERGKFHFYYSIPLVLNLSIHLYLGDNTFNFFEAHPLLLKQNVIKVDEYKIEATVNTLPHLVLTKRSDRYDRALLSEVEYEIEQLTKSNVYTTLSTLFQKFNPVLKQVINGGIQL